MKKSERFGCEIEKTGKDKGIDYGCCAEIRMV
jgi:hypothetical protein